MGREDSSRSTPCRGVRFLCSDVCGNRISEETPHSNPSIVPQMGEYASLGEVETFPVGSMVGVDICTATISAGRARTCSTKQLGQVRIFGDFGQNAICRGMEGVLVRKLIVNTFDDVDLP